MNVQASYKRILGINTAVLIVISTLMMSRAEAQNPRENVYRDASYAGDLSVHYEGEPVGEYVLQSAYTVDPFDDAIENEISQVGCLGDIGLSNSSCFGCGNQKNNCCCSPWWAHRTGATAEFLVLRPGDTDIIYDIEFDNVHPTNPLAGTFPTGPVGRVNIDEESGYRFGFQLADSDHASLVGTYTRFSGGSTSETEADLANNNVLISQIIHPSPFTTGGASQRSTATYEIEFQLIDLAYRRKWKASNTHVINWFAGFRYGNLEQELRYRQLDGVATGLVGVDTDVDFNGFGMLFGLDGARRNPCSGLMIYGRGLTSFLAGNWDGEYVQTNLQTGGGIVANEYEDYRVTPVTELELGFGWQSDCGNYRATIGYLTSAWFNAVSTRDYIDSVRSTDYIDLDETITFSGLTVGVEASF